MTEDINMKMDMYTKLDMEIHVNRNKYKLDYRFE